MNTFLSQTALSTINWLWVLGAGVAAWMMVSAMNRRQSRLTQLLREHVERTLEPPQPAEGNPAEDEAETED